MVTGVGLLVVELFPSFPLTLYPQVHKVPLVLIAVVVSRLQCTCFQLVPPANVVTGVGLLVVELFPSPPLFPEPQTHKVPSVLIAVTCLSPQLTCFQSVPPANVVTGVDLSPVVTPFPSLPLSPRPQVHKVPSVLIAAVKLLPQLTCFQLVPPANVVSGVDLLPVAIVTTALPSAPLTTYPQIHRVPSVLIAAVCTSPALTCFQLVPPANVVFGMDLLPVVNPFPSFPNPGDPQVHRVPSVLIAAANAVPPETCFQLVPPANVVTGVDTLVVWLFPSCPEVPVPQVHKVPSVLIAAVNKSPPSTCFQLVPPANVVTGVDLDVGSLVPNGAPNELFPQIHNSSPTYWSINQYSVTK